MLAKSPLIWNETDVPAVMAADLSAAAGLWLDRERTGCVLVEDAPFDTIEAIESDVLALFAHDPSRGLAVLLRLRCLIDVMSSSRFRQIVRRRDQIAMEQLATAAANLRVNANWGFSPVRLAWSLTALDTGYDAGEEQLAA